MQLDNCPVIESHVRAAPPTHTHTMCSVNGDASCLLLRGLRGVSGASRRIITNQPLMRPIAASYTLGCKIPLTWLLYPPHLAAISLSLMSHDFASCSHLVNLIVCNCLCGSSSLCQDLSNGSGKSGLSMVHCRRAAVKYREEGSNVQIII